MDEHPPQQSRDQDAPLRELGKSRETRTAGLIVAALAALFIGVYVLPLGFRPLVTPDETRYCEIPREMIQSGDWIVPHLNGIRYFEKPPLGYWAIAASFQVCGQNAFAARLPSAVSVGISAILIAMLAYRFGGGRTAAGLATLVFLTCFQVYGLGTFNILDSMFSACVTGGIVATYWWLQQPEDERRPRLLVIVGLCCGLAFLVKGPIGFIVPLLVMVPYVTWERKWRIALRWGYVPIAVALAVAAPWCVAIAVREPDFWRYFLWVEHVQRFITSKHGERIQPFWYLWVVLLTGTFPWWVLIGAIVVGCRRLGLQNGFVRFLICWAAVPFLFFEVSKGKLGTYILPCYPPLAMLIALSLLRYAEHGGRRLVSVGAAGMLGATVAAIGVAPVMLLLANGRLPRLEALLSATRLPLSATQPFGAGEGWKAALGMGCLAIWAMILLLAVRTRDPRRQLVLYGVGPVLGLAMTPLICPVQGFQRAMPVQFLQDQAHAISADSILVCDHDTAYAVCWLYSRSDAFLLHNEGELAYGLSYPDSARRLLSVRDFLELVERRSDKRPVVLILPQDTYRVYMNYLRMLSLDKRLPPPRCQATVPGLRFFVF